MPMQQQIQPCGFYLGWNILPDRQKGRFHLYTAISYLSMLPLHGHACLLRSAKRDLFGLQSNAAQTTQQCGQQCKLVVTPYEGEADQLSGPCGCIARQNSCSLDFSSGIVKDLCGKMGDREVDTAFRDWESVAAGGMRKLQDFQGLPLLVSTE